MTISEKENNNLSYKNKIVVANIFQNNKNKGHISYLRNIMIDNGNPENSFNTNISTLNTDKWTLVFNLSFKLFKSSVTPQPNIIFFVYPTFMSGEYLTYKNVQIKLIVCDNTNERIFKITYEK